MMERRKARAAAIKAGLLFAVLSALWIVLSDTALEALFSDVGWYAYASRIKGLLYTLLMTFVVGALVYLASRRRFDLEQALGRARVDWVTGLPNQAVAVEVLEQRLLTARKEGGAVRIAVFDIQGMGRINRGVGRSAGDEVLHTVGRRLVSGMPRDGVLTRVEGDKYLLIAPPYLDLDGLRRRAEVMMRAASAPLTVDEVEVVIKLRAVVATGPDQGVHAMALLDAADSGLSKARLSRARGVVRVEGVDLRPSPHLRLEADLRRALQSGGLDVYFQPQYSLPSMRLIGAEALARWPHPERGFVPPSDFIPLAEAAGLLDLLTETVLERICSLITAWRAQGDAVPRIAFNISGSELADERVIDLVRNALRAYPECAGVLEMEVTESQAMENPALSRHVIETLQRMDVAVAIDDFGTGYSSLSYLTQFPIDRLKIDRTFVSGAHRSKDKQAVLRAIANLGDNLGVRVMAEGVETEAELAVVRAAGIGEAQGFYFARAMFCDAFRDQCLRSPAFKLASQPDNPASR